MTGVSLKRKLCSDYGRRISTTAVNASSEYKPLPLHFQIPHGIFMVEATSVAVDSCDNVYCFNRGNMPVLKFDRDGNYVDGWGNPTPFNGTDSYTDPYGNKVPRFRGTEYVRPHSVRVDCDDNVWLVDDLGNSITKCDTSGTRLMMLCPGGKVITDKDEMQEYIGKQLPAPAKQSGLMFNRPTDVAVHPVSKDIFITDGYGNSRVHRLTSAGVHICSWGSPGTDPGCFNIPHNISVHPDEKHVMVADRENQRVQLFTLDGVFVEQWHAHRAVAVSVSSNADGSNNIFIAEQGSTSPIHRGDGFNALDTWTHNIGHRIGIYSNDGKLMKALGAPTPGERPEQFNWLHSIAIDSFGDVYAAEVSFCECGKHQLPMPREMVSLRRWQRLK